MTRKKYLLSVVHFTKILKGRCAQPSTPPKKSKWRIPSKQKASVADREQHAPDGFSPTGSISSVCISGRRRCDGAPDGEDGELLPQHAQRK